jgi:hypothetical protein
VVIMDRGYNQPAQLLEQGAKGVELVIKRLKSLLAIDRLKAREHSALAELYLHLCN